MMSFTTLGDPRSMGWKEWAKYCMGRIDRHQQDFSDLLAHLGLERIPLEEQTVDKFRKRRKRVTRDPR